MKTLGAKVKLIVELRDVSEVAEFWRAVRLVRRWRQTKSVTRAAVTELTRFAEDCIPG